ncbi:MAG: diaminopimelate dehydrogenase [Lachnospiraceae bacterium]|nr:diaminopimelate dehydrogenase [Lachnospiraceae bacterium]
MDRIKIGIVGYGNLGRGIELAIRQNADMELAAVFSRRDPARVTLMTADIPVVPMKDILAWKNKIDVMVLCGGSATDLPEMGPNLAKDFNIIDSFDTHAKIPVYYADVDKAAKAGHTLGIISVGWDPGLFSIHRLYAEAVLPEGDTFTFWGKGVSQGHSDAIRRIAGVKAAIQYTVPIEKAMEEVRSGGGDRLTTREKHLRECFVVAEEGADLAKIEETIKTMPDYFADYDTTVAFVCAEELEKNHAGMPHGGFVIRSGMTGAEPNRNRQMIEYALKEESNPEFTSSVLLCYARAAYRLSKQGEIGARTVFDIPPGVLSIKSAQELRASLL